MTKRSCNATTEEIQVTESESPVQLEPAVTNHSTTLKHNMNQCLDTFI